MTYILCQNKFGIEQSITDLICIVFKHLRCTKLGKTQSAEKFLSWSTFLWACLQIREYKIFAFLRRLSAVRDSIESEAERCLERLLSGTDLSKAKGYPGQRWVKFTVALSFQRFACDHCFVFRKVESWRKSRFYKLEIIYKSFNNVFSFLLKAT